MTHNKKLDAGQLKKLKIERGVKNILAVHACTATTTTTTTTTTQHLKHFTLN
jgi:hypothetical protein